MTKTKKEKPTMNFIQVQNGENQKIMTYVLIVERLE